MNPIDQLLVGAVALYFVPTIIAALGRKRNTFAVFVLNLLLGWTFVGWVAALVWSCMSDVPAPVQIGERAPPKFKSAIETWAENYQRQKAQE